MSDRCRNRDCRMNGARRTANMMPPSQNGTQNNLGNTGRGTPNCQGNYPQNGNENRSLMNRLQALDFSIVDTVLYLDAYPHCQEALDYYHKLVSERDALLRAMAQRNTPVTNFENASHDGWDWLNGPWPWELAAN